MTTMNAKQRAEARAEREAQRRAERRADLAIVGRRLLLAPFVLLGARELAHGAWWQQAILVAGVLYGAYRLGSDEYTKRVDRKYL